MPSETPKQARTMAACAHGAKLAICEHIPLKVAKEFNEADQRVKHHGQRGYFRMTKARSQ